MGNNTSEKPQQDQPKPETPKPQQPQPPPDHYDPLLGDWFTKSLDNPDGKEHR